MKRPPPPRGGAPRGRGGPRGGPAAAIGKTPYRVTTDDPDKPAKPKPVRTQQRGPDMGDLINLIAAGNYKLKKVDSVRIRSDALDSN